MTWMGPDGDNWICIVERSAPRLMGSDLDTIHYSQLTYGVISGVEDLWTREIGVVLCLES